MHPLHRQKRRQVGGERGQHEHDEHPVSSDQNAAADRFRCFSASLRRKRSQSEPKTLDQCEFPAVKPVAHDDRRRDVFFFKFNLKKNSPELLVFGFGVVLRAVRRIFVQYPDHERRHGQRGDYTKPDFGFQHGHEFEQRSLSRRFSDH